MISPIFFKIFLLKYGVRPNKYVLFPFPLLQLYEIDRKNFGIVLKFVGCDSMKDISTRYKFDRMNDGFIQK